MNKDNIDSRVELRSKKIQNLMNDNTSVNFYRKIKSKTIEPAKAGSKTLKRSLKCCQKRMVKHEEMC